MKYLHTMLRVSDLQETIDFFALLGFREIKRNDQPKGGFTLVFLAPPGGEDTPVELTYNYESEELGEARFFGHLAYEVDDIHALCQQLSEAGVVINRPPRDGRMAFIRTPDNHSIELLQKGEALTPAEPWVSQPNIGHW